MSLGTFKYLKVPSVTQYHPEHSWTAERHMTIVCELFCLLFGLFGHTLRLLSGFLVSSLLTTPQGTSNSRKKLAFAAYYLWLPRKYGNFTGQPA